MPSTRSATDLALRGLHHLPKRHLVENRPSLQLGDGNQPDSRARDAAAPGSGIRGRTRR